MHEIEFVLFSICETTHDILTSLPSAEQKTDIGKMAVAVNGASTHAFRSFVHSFVRSNAYRAPERSASRENSLSHHLQAQEEALKVHIDDTETQYTLTAAPKTLERTMSCKEFVGWIQWHRIYRAKRRRNVELSLVFSLGDSQRTQLP